MKKINNVIAMTTLAFGLMACGNNKSTESQQMENDSTNNVEIVDTTETDTSAVARTGKESKGFGRCSKCYCKAFEGRAQTCRNCGHAYSYHY